MEGLHFADTHGFAMPMTDAAKPRRSLSKSGKQIYGPNSLKNDSAINIIEKINKPDPYATTQPAAISAAKNALGVSNKPYRPAAGVKQTKPLRQEGPWNKGRESRPLPNDSLAGVPRPQSGEKYALVDKHRMDANRRHSEPLRQQAIGLLQNEERGRQLNQSKQGLERAQSQAEPTQERLNPVQVLPTFDEHGWMVAQTPEFNAPASTESPEVGVPIKTVDQQPVSSQTREHAERLNSRGAGTSRDTQESAPETTAYAPNAQAQAGDAAASEAAALEIASRDAATREAQVRDKVSNDIASLEAATRNAKEKEDNYRATAERRIEQYGLATREANTNAMIGREAADQQRVTSATATQPIPSTETPQRQQDTGGTSRQTSGESQATSRDQENYERAVHLDEYNRFRNATGIGKPIELLSYPRGQPGNTQAAQPVVVTAPVEPQEPFRETLKHKAKSTRHQFLDTVFRRNKPSKKARKEEERLGKRPERNIADDDGALSSGAGTESGFAENVTDPAEAQGGIQQPHKGVAATEQPRTGQGIYQAPPSPLGQSIRTSPKDRPVPASQYDSLRTASQSQGPNGNGGLYLNQPTSGTSSKPRIESSDTAAVADERADGAPITVATTSQSNPPPQQQAPNTAAPASYDAEAAEYFSGQGTEGASVQGAPNRPSTSQEIGESMSVRGHHHREGPPSFNVGSQGRSFSEQAKNVI